MTLSTAAAFNALAASLTARLAKFAKGWFVKYVDWDDASRAENSCWGNNITDVFMKYFKNENWLPMFVVGTENFNPTGVHVKLSQIQLILKDHATGGSRVGTALELLRDVGKFFGTRGLAPDTTLLADGEEDPECFFKVQVAIVPCNEGETVDTAIFATNYQARHTPRNAMFLCNGQGVSLQLDKPNFNGQARYCLAEYNEEKGKWLEFATTTDVSKRTIAQCGTETKEEALQAIAEGKTAEVPIGPKGCKKSCSILSIQAPIDQEELKKPRPQAKAAPAATTRPKGGKAIAAAKAAAAAETPPASKKQKPSPPSSPVSKRVAPKIETRLVKQEPAATEALDDEESVLVEKLVALSPDDHSRPAGAPLQNGFAGYGSASPGGDFSLGASNDDFEPKYTSLSAEPECTPLSAEPVFRSLGSKDEEKPAGGARMGMGGVGAALPQLETEKCKMGRFFKGPYLGEQAPLYGTNLVRDKAGGIVTIVKTIIVTCPVCEEPSEHDVKQLIKLALEDLECAVKCGGQANSLFSEMSKKLGQVTDAITPQAVQGIIETVTAVTGSLPAGIF